MEEYSGVIVLVACSLMILFFVCYVVIGLYVGFKIKCNPVYTNAEIIKYHPKTPNDKGDVTVVVSYAFRAEDGSFYEKKSDSFTVRTVYLDKFYVGKEIPIVYYAKNPAYNHVDVNNSALRELMD